MTENPENNELVSRTQKKREAEAAQDLGVRLLDLSTKQLDSLNLPENLYDAVNIAKNIKAHGGRKRQLQYIGKLMREIDIEPITAFFDQLDNKHFQQNAQFKQLENWRDKLIEGGADAVAGFQAEYANVDMQKLRQLIRNANNKKNEKLALKSKRAIFQYIKKLATENL